MAKPFVPQEKLSKKAKRELNRRKRQTWEISPVTRRSENRKRYDRKRRYRIDDDGTAFFDLLPRAISPQPRPAPDPPAIRRDRARRGAAPRADWPGRAMRALRLRG